MTNQNNAAQAAEQSVLTEADHRQLLVRANFPGLPNPRAYLIKITEDLVLSKLRAPVADERISLSGAANLAFNALHECKPVKGAEKQYSDAIQALQSALHDIAYTVNRTATPQQFADHLQREARAALASAPVAGEAVAWFTEDHLTDKSATTWNRTVAERWRAKGWPVQSLYAAPQASEAVRVRRDTLLSVLGTLNSNPYNLTKTECVDVVRGMFEMADHALSAQPGASAQDQQDMETGRKWRENSSLEAWFPLTAEELESTKRMFGAACVDLARVSKHLGLDPDEGGAAPIIKAIDELRAAQTAQPSGNPGELSAQPGAQNDAN